MANIDYLPRQDFAVQRTSPADILIRSVLIAAVFLSLWFSFHPFAALDEPIELACGEVGDEALGIVPVLTDAGDIGQVHELLRPE